MKLRDGFSLIEVLAAVALLAIASIPLMEMMQALARASIAMEAAVQRLEANLDAEAQLRARETFSPPMMEQRSIRPTFSRPGGSTDPSEFVWSGRHLGFRSTQLALRVQPAPTFAGRRRDIFYIAVRRRYENTQEVLDNAILGLPTD